MLPEYEVHALRYATHDRPRRANFIAGDDLHDSPMPLDYFVWVIRRDAQAWLVDTGFNAETAQRRGRTFLRCPIRSLAMLGVDAERIGHVIVTHLHYDHAGNLSLLPHAKVHLQEREIHYATGCHMCRPMLRSAFAVDDVVEVVRGVYADRVVFADGDARLAPGIECYRVGGHTDGLQVVRVHTRRGWIVLASDASHYYENMESGRPYPIVFHVGDMMRGWDRVRELADSAKHVVPGHDPDVLKRYPRPAGLPRELEGEVVSLHDEPVR